MAINSNGVIVDKDPTRSLCSGNVSNLSSCRLIKIDYSGRESSSSKKSNKANNFKDIKSPYLTTDKLHLLSRVTEKKLIQKKPTDIASSHPLAVTVYKANSDEFKMKKADCKKVKKSVLTLPNEPVRMPKTYTVSDLNDSEYFNDVKDTHKVKIRKRRSVKRNKKLRAKDPEMEYFDRDARYCSQLNIDLDCSSSEVINFNGNGEGICKSIYKPYHSPNIDNDPSDVWAVLRNINKFQFRPTPPASQDSVVPLRKRRPLIKKDNSRNDTRIIETCRTEEFSYISSYEFDSKSQDSCTPSSSFDRITVIDKQSGQEIMNQFREQIFKSNLNVRGQKNNCLSKPNWKKFEPSFINNKQDFQRKYKKENKQILPNTMNKIVSKGKSTVDNITTIPKITFVPKLKAIEAKTSVMSVSSKNCRSSDKNSLTENGPLVTNELDNLAVEFSSNTNQNPSTKLNALKNKEVNQKQVSGIGITKVVLSKGQDVISAKVLESSKKSRLPLTLPNNKTPKITLTEIKRRIARLKFPIVILEKDQLTNQGIHVTNWDPLHFNGLDEHIWPFMREWSQNKRMINIQGNENNEIVVKSKTPKVKHKISPGVESSSLNVQNEENEKKRDSELNDKNTNQKVPEDSAKIEKPKPISILKSKMFQFLHKHPGPVNVTENNWNKNKGLERKKDKIKSTSEKANQIEFGHSTAICLPPQNTTSKRLDETNLFKKSNSLNHSKAKWTSDFIENIIKKVRNGVYYGMDRKEVKYDMDAADISTQTEHNVQKNASCQNINYEAEKNNNDDPLKSIPGFDKALATLEIETFSKNKVAIKHCVTNIVLQFDVQVIAETNNIVNLKNSMSYIPVNQNHKQGKIFKCNKSICNETLPAELCTIMPNMMRSILDANKKSCLPPVTIEMVEPCLTATSEFQVPELNLYSKYKLGISDELRPLLNGYYTLMKSNNTLIKNRDIRLPAHRMNSTTIFPRVAMNILWHLKALTTVQNTSIGNVFEKVSEKPYLDRKRTSICMALQPYEPSKLAVVPFTGPFNMIKFISNIVNNHDLNILNSNLLASNININRNKSIITAPNINQPIVPFDPVNEVVIVSLFKAFIKINHNDDPGFVHNPNNTRSICEGNEDKAYIEIDKNKIELKSNEGKVKRKQVKLLTNKKSYVKCYRKCHSMSSISAFKSTPLSKITTLDEFCQALGSNSISSVLTGCVEKKILRAIDAMRDWIKEISPKQALLVLLLTNKKDTPSITRLRPILLQGIAVNRITKAHELDTEIEVIEKENFSKLSQYDGITYIPASTQNQDDLLEELYWIAKTTASDYKKTFDESSEKLLKSLLEKRKKLNPSYLRVMARYVGLGLLTPAK